MTKLDIYNIALSQHGKRCTKEELTAEYKPTEVEACDRMYEMAVENALGEFDWSFCVRPIELRYDDDRPYGNWAHGYRMPENVIRIARMEPDHKPFMVAGGVYYTNEEMPQVWGILYEETILGMAPRDFCLLVGLWLGYLISTILSPSDMNLSQRILQSYSAQLQTLMKRELNHSQERYTDEWESLE